MSGITTTGSTIISNLCQKEFYCETILQWLGGIGIIVMAITSYANYERGRNAIIQNFK